jgi:exosortase/archaeosortase family protein
MRRYLPVIALLLAGIPVARWYAERMLDGGETAGLVPLLLASYFIFQKRAELGASSAERNAGIAVLLVYALAFPFLPSLVRAVLFIVSVALVSGIARKPGIISLLVLALPWSASLEFFFGYPLRLLTSITSQNFLGLAGMDVTREGVQLLYGGNVVGVDPACSGLNLLWTSGLFTALLGTIFSLSWRKMFPLGFAALAISLLSNSLRASLLFFPESGLVEMPHILHPAIGLVFAGSAFWVLAKLARVLSNPKQHPIILPPSARRPLALTIAALCAAAAPSFSGTDIAQRSHNAPEIDHFYGHPITKIALSPVEENFYAHFPGSIAIYEGRDFKLIVREVTRATRKLHPASHCLRAEGFHIGDKTTITDDEENRWLTYTASRNGNEWNVRERITQKTDGKQWTEISAWYWHAFFHPKEGVWIAETTIVPAPR